MFTQQQEEQEFNYTSDSEWDRDEACEKGRANPDQAWISTGRDVWHANPYYNGPAVPHPEEEEEDYYDEPDVDWLQENEDFEQADEYFNHWEE